MKTGIVDVGGGLRGVYAAGVFDRCMDENIQFDVCIGVSAGAANAASYLAGQRGRNYVFFTDYTFRKEYMSAGNFLRKRSYLDMDYIYGTLSNAGGENPLDYAAMLRNPAAYVAVATDAVTGEPVYFTKDDLRQDDYSILKASCAIPFVCHPYEAGGRLCFDGALGDTIPIQKAFEMGCDKVVLVLTKPRDTVRQPGKDRFFARRIQRKYPKAAQQLRLRAQHYNDGVALAKEYEAQGKLLIIAPADTCGVDTLTKDREAMVRLYEKGIQDGAAILSLMIL